MFSRFEIISFLLSFLFHVLILAGLIIKIPIYDVMPKPTMFYLGPILTFRSFESSLPASVSEHSWLDRDRFVPSPPKTASPISSQLNKPKSLNDALKPSVRKKTSLKDSFLPTSTLRQQAETVSEKSSFSAPSLFPRVIKKVPLKTLRVISP